MFYQDCMAQLGFEATLMTAYFVLLLAHPSYVREQNEVGGTDTKINTQNNHMQIKKNNRILEAHTVLYPLATKYYILKVLRPIINNPISPSTFMIKHVFNGKNKSFAYLAPHITVSFVTKNRPISPQRVLL